MTSNSDFERALHELYTPDALSVRQRILFDERLEERVSRLSFSVMSAAGVFIRSATTAVASASICFALFFLMQSLIRQEAPKFIIHGTDKIELVRLPRAEEPLKRPEAHKPVQQEPPPNPAAPTPSSQYDGIEMGPGIWEDPVGQDTVIGGGIGSTDTDPVVLVRVPPQYPPRAAERGIEGWVLIEFAIDRTGAVADPVVIDADPMAIFDRAAVRSVERWKYRPEIEGGKPVARRGIRAVIRFELDPARSLGP